MTNAPCAKSEIGLGIGQWGGGYLRAMIFTDDCLGWSMSRNSRYCTGGWEVGVRVSCLHGAPSSVQLPGEKLNYCRAAKTSCDFQELSITISYCCSKLKVSMVEDDIDDIEDIEDISLEEERRKMKRTMNEN